MRLSLGQAFDDGLGIRCPYHGLRFGAEGRCVAIPAHPGNKIPARMNLHAYGVIERYGLVWTCLASLPSDPAEAAAIAPVPHWGEPGFQQINCPPIDIAAFAGRQVEGFLDVAHFGFVHEASFGDPGNLVVPDYLVVHFPTGARLSIMNAASPVSARQTRMFDARVRDFDTDQPVQDVYDFNQQIFAEDRAVVEAQKPENLPLDPKLEVNIPADRSSVAYRRALRALGLSQFFTA
jgi:phenylpropionate dioxygenase-like ring-hydroxylating dioxygenase large terminal subunit